MFCFVFVKCLLICATLIHVLLFWFVKLLVDLLHSFLFILWNVCRSDIYIYIYIYICVGSGAAPPERCSHFGSRVAQGLTPAGTDW